MDSEKPISPLTPASLGKEDKMDAQETQEAPVMHVEQKQENKARKPRGGKKFKDFTLDAKQLFTVITEEEMKKVFPLSLSSSDKMETEQPEGITSPFISAAVKESQKAFTENYAPCFSTSGSPLVDFFFNVMEQSMEEDTIRLLENSWKHDDLSTLKLIAQLRAIRDGKGIRRQYQDCLYWLYENHPRTLYENLEELMKFGYWKDALQMLMIIVFEGFKHPYLHQDDLGPGAKGGGKTLRGDDNLSVFRKDEITSAGGRGESKKKSDLFRVVKRKAPTKNINQVQFQEKEQYNKLIAKHYKGDYSTLKPDAMAEMRLRFARDKFSQDLKYRVFHKRIAEIFAKQLYNDLKEMKNLPAGMKTEGKKEEKKNNTISLAGKWAPSIENHFDRYTLISSTIAVELIKLIGESQFEILTKPLPIAVYLSRKTYHKEYCVPLRKFMEIPEQKMSANEWNLVNYQRVPSKCMQRSSKLFKIHDEERFKKYLEKPEAKVSGATLKPIEILTRVMTSCQQKLEDTERIVIEKQWESLVESIKAKGGGLLKNAIAVCDVSGSMEGEPILAAMGLTLITMQMCEKPWDSVCITFHESPKFHNIPAENSLFKKVKSLKNMKWGMNTNLEKVFQLILSMGKKNNLTQEQMPSILFIFTDMEFDQVSSSRDETNFKAAKELFAQNNYTLPTLVCWNLRGGGKKTSTPAQIDERGIVLLSGFSSQQLTLVMEKEDLSEFNSLEFVQKAIEKEQFKGLKIFD